MASISLHIAQPCAESWTAMTPVGSGRHCAACAKTVVDFAQKTDAEILAYLAQATGETCGRLSRDQLNRPLLPAVAKASRPAGRWRAWLALAFAAWGLRATSAAAAGTPASGPRTAAHPRPKPGPRQLTSPAPRQLRGTVRDAATHEPLAGVAVFLKGENRSATTDSAGHFRVLLPAQRPRSGRALVLHYAGYQSVTVAAPAAPTAMLQLELATDPAAAGVTVVGYAVQRQVTMISGSISTIIAAPAPPAPALPRSFWRWLTQPFRQQSKS
jgi:hypothetical protein